MAENQTNSRELVLPQGSYAFVLDSTKGKVGVYVGPYKISLSNTDKMVTWDEKTKRYVECMEQSTAIQVFTVAAEGQYLVLNNPATDSSKYPNKGSQTDAIDLAVGRKINLPGPVSFPLWPGQVAQTIEGHRLRHNEYLVVRVYDEQQALENWKSAVIATTGTTPSTEVQQVAVDKMTTGKLLVVGGNKISFFIPPTGIEVVPEVGTTDQYVRSAVTLERLEYCVLLDENGSKRYVQGPDVVFPEPTEKFIADSTGNRKFRAIELNEHTGLYIKVIAEYKEGETLHTIGEELFIKGDTTAIYFPREEHSIIEYDGKKKHCSIAIPAGEGRYVLDRNLGTIDLVIGPRMYLPDPRSEVIVRRILDPKTVELMFPHNQEALDVNRHFAVMNNQLQAGTHLSSDESRNSARLMGTTSRGLPNDTDEFGGDAFKRGTAYTQPRTLVLDTKYAGAVSVNLWPGYAVLVVKKTGERRVEIGPKMVLLEYDETLMPLELSTGRPKSEKILLNSAYLRVRNNQVGDLVTLETKDLVELQIGVSYRVNFEAKNDAERLKWFEVENYVKILTDHARSRMRNAAKRHGVQEFYANCIDILRDAILGQTPEAGGRKGLVFEENNMRVYDIEILDVTFKDASVAAMLLGAQKNALAGAIELTEAAEEADRKERLEMIKRQNLDQVEKTDKKSSDLELKRRQRRKDADLAAADAALSVYIENQKMADSKLEADKKSTEQEVELARLRTTQEIERLVAEAEVFIKRFGAIDDKLSEAIILLGDKQVVERIAIAVGPAAMAAGTTTSDLLGQIFKGTPFESAMETLNQRPLKSGRSTQ